jgi:hypothetical protein
VQETVGIWWQIYPHDLCFLVDYMIDEAGILVRKSVVILAPHVVTVQPVGSQAVPVYRRWSRSRLGWSCLLPVWM